MAFDQGLADRLRETLFDQPGLSEKRMFGSLCFLLDGNICAGVSRDRLIARVPIELYEEKLSEPGVGKFPNDERHMNGWLVIEADYITEDEELSAWVEYGINLARSLPPK